MDKLIFAANWKMNLPPEGVEAYAKSLESFFINNSVSADVFVLPPLTILHQLTHFKGFKVGAQDLSKFSEYGPYTGDVSAELLKKADCAVTLVGHSERKHFYKENLLTSAQKLQAAHSASLRPIYCIGESEEERMSDATLSVLGKQLAPLNRHFKGIIAYEPLWSIGTGKQPTTDDLTKVVSHIQNKLPQTPVIYGGSVTPQTIKKILSVDGINGALVGGASLKSQTFKDILACAL